MKILILANNDLGLFKFRRELIEALLRKRHEVFLSLPDGDMIRPFQAMGCQFIDTSIDRRGINPWHDLRLLYQYCRIIQRVKPDLVITYTIKPNIYGGLAARLAGRTYAANITGLGTAFERANWLRRMVARMYSTALMKAKVVFVENNDLGEKALAFRLCRAEAICILNGAGVNTEAFAYLEYPDNDIFHFLFVGRVMREKGMDELLASGQRLHDEGEAVMIEVVGPYEEAAYQERLRRAEGEGWLQYHGFQQDPRSFIRRCDCFVLPSWHEGMANTNLESASSGRPIITSDIPGCREALVDGETGLVCQPKDADSLYEAMKRMMALPREARRAMGIRGRARMEAIFEKRMVVDETMRQLFK